MLNVFLTQTTSIMLSSIIVSTFAFIKMVQEFKGTWQAVQIQKYSSFLQYSLYFIVAYPDLIQQQILQSIQFSLKRNNNFLFVLTYHWLIELNYVFLKQV